MNPFSFPQWIKKTGYAGGLHLLFAICLPAMTQAQVFQPTALSALEGMHSNWGCAVADYDQDGDLDVFITAYDPFEANKPQTWSRLLQNKGSSLWVDATKAAGLDQQYQSTVSAGNKIGVSWGDYDNDGFPDLLLTHAGHLQLYHNLQDGTFEEVSRQAKLRTCHACVNTSALWWDYDGDGWLDLYISDYQNTNRLHRNRGDGTFLDVTRSTGLGDDGSTWCSVAFDVDRDGWMDLYVINDYGFSRLYLNEEGQAFREATQDHGLVNTGDAMGVAIGDYNTDGNFDFYISNISEFQPNPLFKGSKSGAFTNEAQAQQVEYANWAWGVQLFDADHDGDEDLYVVNGFGNLTYTNKFFKSQWAQGTPHFVDWSAESACNGEAHGMGVESFDYDQDGDLDLLVANTNDKPTLYTNVGVAGNTNWLQVKLEGTQSNRDAYGAIVKVTGAGRSFYRYHHGAGLMSQSSKPIHFGLGTMDEIDTLTIYWPSQAIDRYHGISGNQTVSVIEGSRIELDSLPEESPLLQDKFLVRQVYPNPFEAEVFIELQTPGKGFLHFQIISPSGTRIYQREEEVATTGLQNLTWNGLNQAGKKVASGLYFYRISLDDRLLTGKIWMR